MGDFDFGWHNVQPVIAYNVDCTVLEADDASLFPVLASSPTHYAFDL